MSQVVKNEDGTWSVKAPDISAPDINGIPSRELAWTINDALGIAFECGARCAKHTMRVALGFKTPDREG